MVWPLVAAAVVSMGSAAYSEYKQGKISKDGLRKRQDLIRKLEEGLRAPPGTAQPFTPEEYAEIQKYSPQIATFVQENRPSLVTESGSQKEKRIEQEGLDAYRSRAQSGRDVIADAQREEALFEADVRAKGRRDEILRNMAARGMSGSGQDILAQMQGSQDAAVGARQASLDAVKQAEARRLDALGNMTNLASGIRGQNRQVEQNNVDIMNSFNQRLASAQNLYNQNVANTQNQAQQFNIRNSADIAMANTKLRNDTNLDNMTRKERAENDLRMFENNKIRDITNMETGLAGAQAEADRARVAGTDRVIQTGASAVGSVYSGVKADQAAKQAATVAQAAQQQELEQRRLDRENNIAVANARGTNRL